MKELLLIIPIFGLFIMASCSSNRSPDCKRFKTGCFEIRSEINNSISRIERNDSIQTETNSVSGHVVKSRIEWISDCEYELTYFTQTHNSSDTIATFIQSRPIKTVILQTGEDYYIFRSSVEGANVLLVDTIRVVKSAID